jgi:hypothetical protein
VNQWSVRNISTGTPVLRRGEEEVGGWRISLCCDREADVLSAGNPQLWRGW